MKALMGALMLGPCPHLMRVSLADNNFTDEGKKAFMPEGEFIYLDCEGYLRERHYTDEGMRMVLQALQRVKRDKLQVKFQYAMWGVYGNLRTQNFTDFGPKPS